MPLNEEAFIERVLQDMVSRGRSPAARIPGCGQISHFDFSRSGKIERARWLPPSIPDCCISRSLIDQPAGSRATTAFGQSFSSFLFALELKCCSALASIARESHGSGGRMIITLIIIAATIFVAMTAVHNR